MRQLCLPPTSTRRLISSANRGFPSTMAQGLRSQMLAAVATGKTSARAGIKKESSSRLKNQSRKTQLIMHQPILTPAALPPEIAGTQAPSPRPSQSKPDRCSFLTILKLREINRRKRRTTDVE